PASNGSVNAEEAIAVSNEKQEAKEKQEDLDKMALTVRVRQQVKDGCRNCCSVRTLKKKLPIIQWLPKYRCREFQCDLIAGLTVGLTVIPQGLAYAVVAGLPPQYGLYSAFMGCFVYMFLGTSKDITLGPTAIMSLMVGTFAASTEPEIAITLALVLTLMTGLVQLIMGLLNLGILVNYISYPVINSFTSAAAVTIGAGQIKNILGLKDIPREFLHMIYETCKHIPDTKVWDLVMGIVSIVILFLLKKLRTIKWAGEDDPETVVPLPKRVGRKLVWLCGTAANAIVVITAGALAAILVENGIDVFSLTGNITSGLPPFGPPPFSVGNMTTGDVFSHIGAGFIIVPILGLVEAIAIGKAFARVNNYKIDATQELIAIGAANIVSSFVHSYPVTGSFSRTAVNSQSNVRTPAGGLFTGALILLSLQVLVPYCYYIPKSALAAVIIMAVIQMIDIRILRILWRINKWDLVIHIITFICSLTVGIEYGILIGIGLSLLLLLYPMARPKLKPDHGLFFPAIEYLESKVLGFATTEEKPRAAIIDMSHISGVDYTTIMGIKSLLADGTKRGVRIVFCECSPHVTSELVQADIKSLTLCGTVAEAMQEVGSQAQDEEEQPFIATL
ncbi:hypothetical protein BaRGS_00007295, partial [Batillaria attramentaria]